jgi:hypothetical protein
MGLGGESDLLEGREMKKPLTPEQIAARDARRSRFRQLVQTISAMSNAERALMASHMAGAVTVEGRQLSMGNACLIACQAPSATLIGGFRQWMAHGRSVRKGEHGLMIWAPTKGTKEPAVVQPGELSSDRPNFIMVTVFDVSQTDPAQAEGRTCETSSIGEGE